MSKAVFYLCCKYVVFYCYFQFLKAMMPYTAEQYLVIFHLVLFFFVKLALCRIFNLFACFLQIDNKMNKSKHLSNKFFSSALAVLFSAKLFLKSNFFATKLDMFKFYA